MHNSDNEHMCRRPSRSGNQLVSADTGIATCSKIQHFIFEVNTLKCVCTICSVEFEGGVCGVLLRDDSRWDGYNRVLTAIEGYIRGIGTSLVPLQLVSSGRELRASNRRGLS